MQVSMMHAQGVNSICRHAAASSTAPFASRSSKSIRPRRPLRQCTRMAAEDTDDSDFDQRLDALKRGKGATPYGKSRQDKPARQGAKPQGAKKQSAKYDYTDEQLHFESAPHRGDLAVNVALGATLLWLPLTAAAVGRGAFVKYRITDKRISVITNAPWKKEQLDAPYQEVADVQSVGRGVGLWGDMVVTLKNGDKVEMRSLPKFQELKQYIRERRDALSSSESDPGAPVTEKAQKGFKK